MYGDAVSKNTEDRVVGIEIEFFNPLRGFYKQLGNGKVRGRKTTNFVRTINFTESDEYVESVKGRASDDKIIYLEIKTAFKSTGTTPQTIFAGDVSEKDNSALGAIDFQTTQDKKILGFHGTYLKDLYSIGVKFYWLGSPSWWHEIIGCRNIGAGTLGWVF